MDASLDRRPPHYTNKAIPKPIEELEYTDMYQKYTPNLNEGGEGEGG